jgi:hypothetical protein
LELGTEIVILALLGCAKHIAQLNALITEPDARLAKLESPAQVMSATLVTLWKCRNVKKSKSRNVGTEEIAKSPDRQITPVPNGRGSDYGRGSDQG